MSLASTVCVLKFHYRGHNKNKVPSWIKRVLFIEIKNININSGDKPNGQILLNDLKDGSSRRSLFSKKNSTPNFCSVPNSIKKINLKKIENNNNDFDELKMINDKEKNIKKMLSIVKSCSKIINKEREKAALDEILLLEWKEVVMYFIRFFVD